MSDDNTETSTEENTEATESADSSNESASSNANGNSSSGGSNAKQDVSAEKTFTQAEVTKMMTKEKHQGKNSAYAALGIDPTDKDAMSSVKSFVAAQKKVSEDASNSANDEKDRTIAFMGTKLKLIESGVKPKYAEDMATLMLAKSGNDVDVDDELESYKEKYAEWFNNSDDGSQGNAGDDGKKKLNGTGSSVNGKSSDNAGKSESAGIGKRLAAQRSSNKTGKSSYWK